MSENYRSVKRYRIPWYPTIDYEKCINCGVCLEYCKLDVYKIEENKKDRPFVKNPNNCVVFCTGCKGKCPVGAITFPSKPITREIIKQLLKNVK